MFDLLVGSARAQILASKTSVGTGVDCESRCANPVRDLRSSADVLGLLLSHDSPRKEVGRCTPRLTSFASGCSQQLRPLTIVALSAVAVNGALAIVIALFLLGAVTVILPLVVVHYDQHGE
jgi:hypothetical protein